MIMSKPVWWMLKRKSDRKAAYVTWRWPVAGAKSLLVFSTEEKASRFLVDRAARDRIPNPHDQLEVIGLDDEWFIEQIDGEWHEHYINNYLLDPPTSLDVVWNDRKLIVDYLKNVEKGNDK
jgi:hypothetical protein